MIWKKLFAATLATASVLAQSATLPQGLQPGDEYRILFVTDSTRDATSSNIADYDAFVRTDATTAPVLAAINTTWRALASTPSVAAKVHTGTDGSGGVPIYRPDGVRVADGYTRLWGTLSQPLLATPNITASGAVTGASRVWSGCWPTGTADEPLGDASGNAVSGAPSRTTYSWLYGNSRPQTGSLPLYGISDVLTVPYPDYPTDLKPGDQFRILFVTDSERNATSSDIADYDAFVSADAQAVPAMAHFVTSWRALATTPSVTAKVHTGTDGSGGVPIYRPDGVRVADNYTRLWGSSSQQLLATPNITASGAVTGALRVWNGCWPNGTADMPLGGASGNATGGLPARTSYSWLYGNSLPQTGSLPLYGISDVITVPAPRHPQDLQPGDEYRVLVVTHRRRNATSSNIADYDAFVNDDADAVAGLRLLRTDWLAVASVPGMSARAHSETTGTGDLPIYRPDGVRIADDYDHLWGLTSSPLLAPPNITTRGAVTSTTRVWTGSTPSGLVAEALGSGGSLARTGMPGSVNGAWSYGFLDLQGVNRRFYAISKVISVPYPAEIGTSCGPATLARDTLPEIGGSFDSTLSGVPANGIGAVLVDLGLPTAGTPQPTPPFVAGCVSYLNASVTLGLALQSSQQFSIAIPNDIAYVGLPITEQAAVIDLSSGEVSATNAIAARVTDS